MAAADAGTASSGDVVSGDVDLYEILEVDRKASADEIRLAYRRLALAWHPDKHRGADAEAAGERFKLIAMAHGILSDEEKRRKYDQGGVGALAATDMEVDMSQVGMAGTAFAAMASKLGLRIKTAVSQQVLTAAYDGSFLANPIQFNSPVTDKVEKQLARFYSLHITQQQLDQGFVISAYSTQSSKFKLLLFETTPDCRHELVFSEESRKLRKMSSAGLYFLREKTIDVGATPGILELQGSPENALFRRLDNCKEREAPQVKPGNLLIAVYGDNWFQQVRYTLQILYPVTVPEAVNRCDKQVMAKRDELRAFERTFTAAQAEYAAALDAFAAHRKGLEDLLEERNEAYSDLLRLPVDRGLATSTQVQPSNGVGGMIDRLWKRK